MRSVARCLVLALLLGCSADKPADPTGVGPQPGPAAEIKIQVSDTIVVLGSGETKELKAYVTGTTTTAVSWSSSNGGIANVSPLGVITGINAGNATVTARSVVDATKAVQIFVTVSSAFNNWDYVISSLTPDTVRLNRGGKAGITVTVTRTGGVAPAINVSVANLPAGVTAEPAFIPAGAAFTTTVPLTADSTAMPGTTRLTVRAFTVGRERTGVIPLVVR